MPAIFQVIKEAWKIYGTYFQQALTITIFKLKFYLQPGR